MVFADGFIDRVSVGEVGGCIPFTLLFEGSKLRLNSLENLVGFCCVEIFIIISSVIVSSIGLPMVLDDVSDGDQFLLWIRVLGGQDLEPAEDCPDTILFSHVRRSSAETLFTADLNLVGVKKISEELPACWGFVTADVELFADHVNCSGGWHTSSSS